MGDILVMAGWLVGVVEWIDGLIHNEEEDIRLG